MSWLNQSKNSTSFNNQSKNDTLFVNQKNSSAISELWSATFFPWGASIYPWLNENLLILDNWSNLAKS